MKGHSGLTLLTSQVSNLLLPLCLQKTCGRKAQVTNSTEDSLGVRCMELGHSGVNLASNEPMHKTCMQEDCKIGERKNNNLRFPMTVLYVLHLKSSASFLLPLYFKINVE